MSKTPLKSRNAFSDKVSYDRKTQVRILRAQLQEQLGKKPDCIQQSLINAACTLTISLHDMEQQFEDGALLSSRYEARLRSLQTILGKLGLKSKGPKSSHGKKGQDKDLSNIIDG